MLKYHWHEMIWLNTNNVCITQRLSHIELLASGIKIVMCIQLINKSKSKYVLVCCCKRIFQYRWLLFLPWVPTHVIIATTQLLIYFLHNRKWPYLKMKPTLVQYVLKMTSLTCNYKDILITRIRDITQSQNGFQKCLCHKITEWI